MISPRFSFFFPQPSTFISFFPLLSYLSALLLFHQLLSHFQAPVSPPNEGKGFNSSLLLQVGPQRGPLVKGGNRKKKEEKRPRTYPFLPPPGGWKKPPTFPFLPPPGGWKKPPTFPFLPPPGGWKKPPTFPPFPFPFPFP